uniref:Aldo_ket_red domain-containing protein n=1 Tax=Parastrongyloides trichosuri TaxID=131310 RepID=A0A0N4ZNR8_PARTI
MSYVKDKMPMVGYGTYQIKSKDIFDCLDTALECGYRLIDTAQCYGNEEAIGDALQILLPKYGLSREDIFITTKLAPKFQGKEKCRKAVLKSLEKLQVDYIDLLLIHWPGTAHLSSSSCKNSLNRKDSWSELENFYFNNIVKSIGVSNYNIPHLEELLSYCKVKPELNQCEFHPYYNTPELVSYCKKNDIHFQAYSSLGSAKRKDDLLNDIDVIKLADLKGLTVPQLLLSWSLSQGISVLPRSKSREHIFENFQKIDVKLSKEDINLLIKQEQIKFCWDSSKVL